MEQKISKEELRELESLKGKVRGVSLKADGGFVLKEMGEEGVKRLEKTMSDLGYPIVYSEIKEMDYYPIFLKAMTLIVLQRLFNFQEKDFMEMGRYGSKVSLILRLFVKYFFSFERVMKEIPKIWRKYYTVGDLKVAEYNKEKRYLIGKLYNFNLHPLECQYLKGYFPTVLRMIIRDEMTCEEIKCLHKGDDYHEFLLKW